ncbi:hypothetical protein [Vreelandella populi]|uniref:Uncharacterized protein n=1 Tax=Vreelandella populi TaxID=2498858 RepID=A0A433LBR9_9GAMM|nr:hypothetical protein [Halomonas populi]RUR46210.1 hypothetical protein ELY37_09480 [Halomonas populi]
MFINITHGGKIYSEWEPEKLINAGVPADLVIGKAHEVLSARIDTAAGEARVSFVSPGSYIDQEYLLAKQEATNWLENGKDESAIPSSVQDHINMFDVDAETAAKEIVATAEEWEQALGTIRSARLGGKAAVSRAATIEDAEAAAQQAIEQLNRYRPPEA